MNLGPGHVPCSQKAESRADLQSAALHCADNGEPSHPELSGCEAEDRGNKSCAAGLDAEICPRDRTLVDAAVGPWLSG